MGSFFPIKDRVDNKHLSGIVYGFNVPGMEANRNHYIGETNVRHETRMYQHAFTDKESAIYKHSQNCNYTAPPSKFSILAKGYHIWKDRKIC